LEIKNYVNHTTSSRANEKRDWQILSISAFDKTPICELLSDFQNNQNVNEQQYNIFDNLD
jgi:hypothetical protein